MMVAHVDPGKRTGVLVSFPRDLWVPIPGHGTPKINAAFRTAARSSRSRRSSRSSTSRSATTSRSTSRASVSIVDAIGSVPIFFPAPARDKNTGLNITTPGCHELNGDEALAYVRSRYYEYEENGEWKSDPTSDIGRIQRQQYFIRSVATRRFTRCCRARGGPTRSLDKRSACLSRDQKLTTVAISRRSCTRSATPIPTVFPMFTLPATNVSCDNQSVLMLDAAPAGADAGAAARRRSRSSVRSRRSPRRR